MDASRFDGRQPNGLADYGGYLLDSLVPTLVPLEAGPDAPPDVLADTSVIDASSEVGRDLNRLFAGFLRREFGPDTFRIERLQRDVRRTPPLAAEPAAN